MGHIVFRGLKHTLPGRSILIPFVMVFLISACVTPPEGARMNIFHGNFSVVGEPILNQEVELTYFIEPEIDVPSSSMRIYLSRSVDLVEGNLNWTTGRIEEGERREFKFRLKVVEEGESEIIVYSNYIGETGQSAHEDAYYIFFETTENDGKISRHRFREITASQPFTKST